MNLVRSYNKIVFINYYIDYIYSTTYHVHTHA
jgi:hypothetical protein